MALSHREPFSWSVPVAAPFPERLFDLLTSFVGLAAEKYVVRVRSKNALGWSKWSWNSKPIMTPID